MHKIRKRHAVAESLRFVLSKNPLLTMSLILSIALSVILGLLPPLILERIVNNLTNGSGIRISLAVAYVGITILALVMESLKEVAITVFGQKITHRLRSLMAQKMNQMKAAYFQVTDPGITVSRFVNDVDTIESLFDDGVISMFSDLISIVGILGIIASRSRGLFVLMLIVLPLVFLMTRRFQRQMLAAQIENRKAIGDSSRQIPETLHNLRTIHNLAAEHFMEERYQRSIEHGFEAVNRTAFYDSIYSPIILSVGAVVVALMMSACTGTYEMKIFFGMSVGTAAALVAYVSKVFDPVQSLGMEIQNIQEAAAGIERLNEFLNEDERELGRNLKKQASDLNATQISDTNLAGDWAVEFSHVTFSYDLEVPVLKDFSMQVRKGEMVTLMGRTGAGKTTIFRLILGLFEPQKGSVLVNGERAGTLNDRERRSKLACVEQNFRFIPGTVRDQITLKNPDIKEEQVVTTLRQVGILDLTEGLKDGLDTEVSESMFSQGQKQLLGIARAIVCNPEILLLDEITANLDSVTESQVLEALDQASKERTTISISHRLFEKRGQGRIIEI